MKKCPRRILEQPVCPVCILRFARDPRKCPGCGQAKVLAFYDTQRRAACAGCTGNPAIYACHECGREDSQWGSRCALCVLAERVAALLAQPGGEIHPQLKAVYDVLLAGPRPQSTLYWLTHSAGPGILRSMARGDLEISHATFETRPTNKTNNYLRDLLAAVGVLPPFNAELERVTPWLNDILTELPADQADILNRYARWSLLRRLRHHEQAGTLTHGAIAGARASIVATRRFMDWQTRRGRTIADTTQDDLDRYLEAHRGRTQTLRPFVTWARGNQTLAAGLDVPIRATPRPAVTLSDNDRWAQVELLLHDDTIRLYTRVAGLLLLLFAQPLSRICRIRSSQVTDEPNGRLHLTFDTFAVELPEPLDQLVRQQLTRRGQASYVSRPDHWLFPGGIPGRHLATENIRSQLVERGIQPLAARNAAMFQLAGQIPTPILADLLGLKPHTATRWAALAARDWSQYAAQRADAPAFNTHNE